MEICFAHSRQRVGANFVLLWLPPLVVLFTFALLHFQEYYELHDLDMTER